MKPTHGLVLLRGVHIGSGFAAPLPATSQEPWTPSTSPSLARIDTLKRSNKNRKQMRHQPPDLPAKSLRGALYYPSAGTIHQNQMTWLASQSTQSGRRRRAFSVSDLNSMRRVRQSLLVLSRLIAGPHWLNRQLGRVSPSINSSRLFRTSCKSKSLPPSPSQTF